MTLSLSIDRLLRATPERLYSIWTDSEHLTRWFGVKVQADARVGGDLLIHFYGEENPMRCRFTALRPHDLVAFTWDYEGETTQVQVTFERVGDKTRLALKHEGFLDEKSFASHDEGWFEYFELWSVMVNAGPEEGLRASLSGIFPKTVDVPTLLASWLNKPMGDLVLSAETGGLTRFKSNNFEAQWQLCRFGTSLAVTEWGLTTEEQRVQSRNKWKERFATLGG